MPNRKQNAGKSTLGPLVRCSVANSCNIIPCIHRDPHERTGQCDPVHLEVEQYTDKEWYIKCNVCGTCGPNCETKEIAVGYWNSRAKPTAQHILRDAKIIIETIANQYSGDTLGEIDCEIKTHPDYPRSWIRDAAKDWLSKIPSDFGCEPTEHITLEQLRMTYDRLVAALEDGGLAEEVAHDCGYPRLGRQLINAYRAAVRERIGHGG